MTNHPMSKLGRLGQAALAAAEAGHYVFPLHPRTKFPAVEKWEQAATRDPEQIRQWWSARPYNLALACGPGGLVVVDLDDAHGEPAPEPWTGATGGRDVLARLAAKAGQPVPTGTYTVSTPTGGLHLYFRAPAGAKFRNTAGTLGWRIDTRACGGYVVAATSVRDEGYYRAVNRAPIAELPEWLARALTPPPPPAPSAPIVLPTQRASAYLRKILEQEADQVAAAVPGTRHATLLAAARTLGRLVGGGALSEQEARDTLTAAAAGHVGVEGTTRAEVDRTIADGLAYGAQLPRRIDTTRSAR